MQYPRLYQNHPMAYLLAVDLAAEKSLDFADAQLLFFTVNLLGAGLSAGHVCINLMHYAGTAALADFEVDYIFPPVEEWQQRLQQSDSVADEATATPLVLNGCLLYLRKYADWEQRLAQTLITRASEQSDGVEQAAQPQIDWQQVAVANTLRARLSIIVGGPGTGKTTTVANLLQQLLQQEGHAHYRVALAAPTGKAAARMAQALHEKLPPDALPAELAGCIPQKALTIHRLLGWSQPRRRFMFNRQHPLLLDCLIVDEASMIDMAMFVALLEAVPLHCRVILLGDPFQLASVQAGNVLAEMCSDNALRGFSAQRYRQLGLPAEYETDAAPLQDNIVYLQKSYRFADDKGIGLLARACLQGDAQALTQALQQQEVCFLDKRQHQAQLAVIDAALAHYRQLAASNSLDDAFARLADFQLLCATKQGDYSVAFYNDALQQRIAWQQSIAGQPIYHGMPVMMRSNHYALNLFNGDMGLVWQSDDQLWLVFRTAEGEYKRFLPSQIQGWECAHAMTVHKSQGSEYEKVALVLPEQDSPLLSREMLYTAITRAKQHFTCLANTAELQAAISRPTLRHSGLSRRLALLG